VIGDLVDLTGGTTVYFWGAQWAQNNPMTRGPGPAAFKGFAGWRVPPTCGGMWSSEPGNSSDPPARIPLFMAVIVSNSAETNGSVITGDVRSVVVIQTDPGYGPSPGQTGTGKVIAVICGSP
jgi:hypothetical protein